MTMPVSHVTVRVPLTIRRRPGRRTMVSLPFEDGGGRIATKADPALVKALARAFRYQRMLDEGRYATITEMAAGERIERGYLGSLLRLTLLAPDLVTDALDGRHMPSVTLAALSAPFPLCWRDQAELFGNDAL